MYLKKIRNVKSDFSFLALLAAVFFLFQSNAQARQQLSGHVPKAVADSPLVGDVADGEIFHLAIGLPLRNQDALNALIQNIYDRKSSQYRHFLTADQFAQQFGPSPSDYQTLVDFAKSNGLSILSTSPNHTLLSVSATAADINRVFHVKLHYYRRPNGTKFMAPENEPSIDLDLPILHVSGLDNYGVPHSNMVIKEPINKNSPMAPPVFKTTPNLGSGLFGGDYWGSDYRNVYVPNAVSAAPPLLGAGQSIALFELDNYNSVLIGDYASSTYANIGNLSNVTTEIPTGGTTPGLNEIGGECEVELDIEMAMSMAPSAKIIVYETSILNTLDATTGQVTNPTLFLADIDNLYNQIATDNTCKQISSSWSFPGVSDSNQPPIFQQYAVQGQSFFQAAGDLGAYVSDDPNPYVPAPISETSMMTVVGGTHLSTTGTDTKGTASGSPVGVWSGESVWNDSPGPVATQTPAPNAVGGGGICTGLVIPWYQQETSFGTNGGSTQYRNIPDVAMIADDEVIVAYDPNVGTDAIYPSGGTSAAAPLWAGFLALVNDQASLESPPSGPIGFINPAIYSIGGNSTEYANDFHDVTTGNNNYWGSNTSQYSAVTGYDLATGWGSPNNSNATETLMGDLIGIAPSQLPCLPNGIIANSGSATFSSADWAYHFVDAYNSAAGPYNVNTNAICAGNIQAAGAIDTNDVRFLAQPCGNLIPNTPAHLTPVPVPADAIVPPGTGGIINLGPAPPPNNAYTLAAGDYVVSELNVSQGGNLYITGPVRIWVTGAVTLQVFNLQAPSGLPKDLQIFSTSTTTSMTFYASNVNGVIFAPNAPVSLTATTQIFGAVVGSSIYMGSPNIYPSDGDNPAIHVDETLLCTIPNPIPSPTPISWDTVDTQIASYPAGGPEGIALDNLSNLYVADDTSNQIDVFNSPGSSLSPIGTGDFTQPMGVAVDGMGYVYATDSASDQVYIFNKQGTLTAQWAISGTPAGIAVSGCGSAASIYVVNQSLPGVQVFNNQGRLLNQWGTPGTTGNGTFGMPVGIALDGGGYVYVADMDTDYVQVFNPQGIWQRQWDVTSNSLLLGANFIGVYQNGSQNGPVFVSDGFQTVAQFDVYGNFLEQIQTGSTNFSQTEGVAVGKNDWYVADRLNQQVYEFDFGNWTISPTPTNTSTGTPTLTPTFVPFYTATPTWTDTFTNTVTRTVTNTATNTSTNTATSTSTYTATNTLTYTVTPTATITPTHTFTQTPTYTTNKTPTYTETPLPNACANFPDWSGAGVFYAVGKEVVYGTEIYKCIQAHTSVSTWEPPNTPSLWQVVAACVGPTSTPSPFNCSTAPAWSADSVYYALGAQVIYSNVLYQCVTAHTSNASWAPPNTPTLWQSQGSCSGITHDVASLVILENGKTFTPTPSSTATVTITNTITTTPTTASGLLLSAVAAPNISKNEQPIKFIVNLGSSATAQLSLYSLLGQEVYSETIQGNAGLNSITWFLRNKGLEPVGSGLYIYMIQVNNGTEKAMKLGKVMVIH